MLSAVLIRPKCGVSCKVKKERAIERIAVGVCHYDHRRASDPVCVAVYVCVVVVAGVVCVCVCVLDRRAGELPG